MTVAVFGIRIVFKNKKDQFREIKRILKDISFSDYDTVSFSHDSFFIGYHQKDIPYKLEGVNYHFIENDETDTGYSEYFEQYKKIVKLSRNNTLFKCTIGTHVYTK